MVKDIAVGALFAIVGGFFLVNSLLSLEFGTAFRMGPGYFPAVLGGALCLLGVTLSALGFRSAPSPFGPVPWRGLAFILTGLVAFGIGSRWLGILPSLVILVALSAAASRRITLPFALLLIVGLVSFCLLVFVYALGLHLPLLGTLFG